MLTCRTVQLMRARTLVSSFRQVIFALIRSDSRGSCQGDGPFSLANFLRC